MTNIETLDCKWTIDPIETIAENFIWPKKAERDSAGWDLFHNADDMIIEQGQVYTIDLGFRSKISPGWCSLVMIRSGISKREDMSLLNAPGLIDSSYRQSWKLIVRKNSGKSYLLKRHFAIAQAIFMPVYSVEMKQWEHNSSPFDDSERKGGLGSSLNF